MNTVFKFSLQAWQLYALGSAYGAWYVGRFLWAWEGWSARLRDGRQRIGMLATAAGVALFLGSAIFLWSGTRARQELRFVDSGPTLNGYVYFNGGGIIDDHGTPQPGDDTEFKFADDKPLIDYLRNEVQGTPIIAEAVGPLYHWTSRMSWNTGLPTVIGWDWHQTQQRWDYVGEIHQRRADTEQFFSTPDAAFAADYMVRYRVEYVVVGIAEYQYGTLEGVEKFASMPELTEVFRSGRYAIYRATPEFAARIY
jgi:uncharacterized membrane protein